MHYDPTTSLGAGEHHSRRAVWRYHRLTAAGWWGMLTATVGAFAGAMVVHGWSPARAVLMVGGVVCALAWVAIFLRLVVLRRRMVRRKRKGRRLRCGYLRRHQAAGICSECGTVPWWDDHELARR